MGSQVLDMRRAGAAMTTQEAPPDNRQELFNTLAFLTGHLDATSARDRYAVDTLQDKLAQLLPRTDLATARNRFFSVESSDLFFADAVAPQTRARLVQLSERIAAEARPPELRAFVRDVPMRTTQIPGSVPSWAGGAAVAETLGPFLNKDGRRIWFDFYKITQLVALYLQGRPDPAILFNVSLVKKFPHVGLPAVVDALTVYHLVPDSVWINSALLAANAPATLFTGLKIKGGAVTLSAAPQLIDGKLTLAANTKATVALDLDPAAAVAADAASPYGADARKAKMHLPEKFTFHFTGGAGAIDAVDGRIDWSVYGQAAEFRWNKTVAPAFEALLNRVLIPLDCSVNRFTVTDCVSPFMRFAGAADIARSAWALPVAQLDVGKPPPAAGIGGLAVHCKGGLTAQWQGLKGGAVNLPTPWLLSDPGRLNVTDLQAGNVFCTQEYLLWKDALNSYGTSVKLTYTAAFPFIFNTTADGNEAFLAFANANPLLDRPVTVTGLPFDIHAKNSALIIAVNKAWKLIYLFDDNILFDNYDPKQPKATLPAPLAVALQNALFRVTPVNGFLLFGALADDMVHVERGVVFLTLGMYGYVPTLPDPYAANLGVLRAQFERTRFSAVGLPGQTVWLWLVAQTQWQPQTSDTDQVEVSFHFAPLQNQFAIAPPAAQQPGQTAPPPEQTAAPAAVLGFREHPFVQLFEAGPVATAAQEGVVETAMMMAGTPVANRGRRQPPDYQGPWRDRFGLLDYDAFALLDVSSNANQMGVSFASLGASRVTMMRTHAAVPAEQSGAAIEGFPLQVQGMDVVARSPLVRAFTTPIVSWEPVINLTPPEEENGKKKFDPPVPLNYYPDDGGPTRIFNNSARLVPIAPIPVCDSLVDAYDKEPDNITLASFTLPFGIRSLAYLYKTNAKQQGSDKEKPSIRFNAPEFDNDLKGGIQLKLSAGSGPNDDESNMFSGFTLQMNNVLDLNGQPTDTTTLGEDVAFIFNGDFFNPLTNMDDQRGVPVTRIDVSGYGASTFSNWTNEGAQFAATSQVRFDVMVGRTAHEVIQVKSILYPWGVHVVRTVTLFRVGSGYVYRFDSGWKAQSDGKFDFHFNFVPDPSKPKVEQRFAPYKIHPGTVRGLFNVQNIKTAIGDVLPFTDSMDITSFFELSPAIDKPVVYSGGTSPVSVNLQPVYFDADVELENVVQGQVNGRVPAKKILGFVQLAPRGIPLTPGAFQRLLVRQFGSIGGPLACIMDIGKSGQKLRVNFVDVNASVDTDGTTPVFVAAARGHVVLPKDGSWSLVMHARGTGDVTPLPDSVSVPLIRIGELADNMKFPDTELLRIANPADLVRAPAADTINFGFLQSTNTQKTLFLTPSFAGQASDTTPGKMLSKTPPLFVDAYRLMGSKAIFPNIGDAETNFGSAITLTKNFVSSALQDGGKNVLELMHISSADGATRLKEDGYKLANAVKSFDLPAGPWHLIDEDYLKIYVEYEATPSGGATRAGVLDFDVDSFAAAAGDRWKSRLNNMAMVVDLGPFPRLATIKGNFDAKKGSEAGYLGDPGDPAFAAPQLELSDALEKAKDILQILAALQGGDYVEAFKRGLKIAMSNGADSWEYKFEASQEIPVLKFPPGPLANDPNAPLKLEASLKLGVYFNAALTTAALSDPKKLLPTAGAFVEFYGRLSVMCVSISIATVYAVGQANLRIAGDTGVGPSLDMKFGFGAQLVVGLPVVGNVSVLYMVGVEIYVDAKTLSVSAFMMFQGHAELIGGLVSITITIEAKGTVKRLSSPDQTVCAAQVTFAIDISIFLVIDINFSKSWEEQRQIA
jgi:hypothetical protein